MVGLSTMSLTGFFYLRNNRGDLLIDPTTGLPVRSNVLSGNFVDRGYDRQPDFTIGLTNSFRYKRFGLDFLRSEEHTSELQSRLHLVCRLLLEKKNKQHNSNFDNIK